MHNEVEYWKSRAMNAEDEMQSWREVARKAELAIQAVRLLKQALDGYPA